jgi:phage-related protein
MKKIVEHVAGVAGMMLGAVIGILGFLCVLFLMAITAVGERIARRRDYEGPK